MPATVQSAAGVYTTLGEAWAGCVANMIANLNILFRPESLTTNPNVSTLGGRLSIFYTWFDGTQNNDEHFLVDSMDTGEEVKVGDFLQEPGAQQSIGIPFTSGIDDTAAYNFVVHHILHGMPGILLAATDATGVAETFNERTNAAGGYKTAIQVLQITTPNCFFVMTQAARGSIVPRASWGWTPCAGPLIPLLTPVIPVPGSDSSEIVEAINEITDQDFELGLNQNAALFSVKSKVVVGP